MIRTAICVRPTDTVSYIKEHIATKFGMPFAQQKLLFGNRFLVTHASVRESQLHQGALVDLYGHVSGGKLCHTCGARFTSRMKLHMHACPGPPQSTPKPLSSCHHYEPPQWHPPYACCCSVGGDPMHEERYTNMELEHVGFKMQGGGGPTDGDWEDDDMDIASEDMEAAEEAHYTKDHMPPAGDVPLEAEENAGTPGHSGEDAVHPQEDDTICALIGQHLAARRSKDLCFTDDPYTSATDGGSDSSFDPHKSIKRKRLRKTATRQHSKRQAVLASLAHISKTAMDAGPARGHDDVDDDGSHAVPPRRKRLHMSQGESGDVEVSPIDARQPTVHQCDHCDREFSTITGLHIHITRKHKAQVV